ncbi:unnamed protein product, partial [Choristocarpus tenellus]
NWTEAVKLSEEHAGKFDKRLFLPYARWLEGKGRFDDALGAYLKAGRRDLSRAMMGRIIHNSVIKTRFDDVAYYYWSSSNEARTAAKVANEAADEEEAQQALELANEHSRLADLYHAFHLVHSFTVDPFTSLQPDVLLQVSRFLINSLGEGESPQGISRAHTLYTLAKQAKILGAFKLARFAYDRLQRQQIPPLWQDQIDFDMLTVQAKPVRDSPELLVACFRCGSTNPLLNPFISTSIPTGVGGGGGEDARSEETFGIGVRAGGDACTTCRHQFVRSFINFEALPLVQFEPESG